MVGGYWCSFGVTKRCSAVFATGWRLLVFLWRYEALFGGNCGWLEVTDVPLGLLSVYWALLQLVGEYWCSFGVTERCTVVTAVGWRSLCSFGVTER